MRHLTNSLLAITSKGFPPRCRAGSQGVLPLLQAYFMLDEMLIAGELQEPSKKVPHLTDACLSPSYLEFPAHQTSLLILT